MRRPLFVALVLILTGVVLSQAQTQQSAAGPKRFQLGVGLSYFHPNLDALNTAYAGAEHVYGLARWPDFAVNYLGEAFIRMRLEPQHLVSARGAGSFVMRTRSDDSKSFYTIYRAGLGYDYQAVDAPVRVLVGASAGWLQANFQRTYGGGDLSISTAKNTWYVDAGVAAQLPVVINIVLEADLRYMYAPEVKFGLDEATPKLRSPAIGISLVFER